MKKIGVVLLACVLVISAFTSCGRGQETEKDKINIVTTVFPAYDWVRQLLGDDLADKAELTLLAGNGTDMHNYQPNFDDIVQITSCDFIVYVGGESEAWVEQAVASTEKENRASIGLIQALGDRVKAEEIKEGMSCTEEPGHDEAEADEHVWLSLKNAAVFCQVIADQLVHLLPECENEIRLRAQDYQAQLAKLDQEYAEAVDRAPHKTLLFGDRFPFRYLTDDYGLEYYAAFPGCSAETEASFETIIYLAGKADELGLTHLITIDHSDQTIAKTIIQNTQQKNQDIITLDSMQAVSLQDTDKQNTYLSIMQENLRALMLALNVD